jgi:phosphoglycerate kinase
MEEEIGALGKALENPARPSVAIVAGAKISTKLELLSNLSRKVDTILIGGAMANTFLFANGENIGSSLAERDMADTAKRILEQAKGKIVLPVDGVVATSPEATSRTTSFADMAQDEWILDIGSESVKLFKDKIAASKTLLMNGPVGLFEVKPFDKATTDLAIFIASRVKTGELMAIAGGGDTVSALELSGSSRDFTYISTAGGAFLEWLEGKTLPAIPPLEK